MVNYRGQDYDVRDPYQRAAYLEQLEADKAATERDLQERQEKRMAGLDVQWHVPPPEPAPASQRASNGRETHAHEWAAHTRAFATASVEAAERKLKARQDHQLERLADAMGKVLAQEREQHRADIEALKAEIAALKASDDHVIDMRGVFGSKRDAA